MSIYKSRRLTYQLHHAGPSPSPFPSLSHGSPCPGTTAASEVCPTVPVVRGSSPSLVVRVLVTQSCPTLCDPMDCSLLGSSGVPWNSPGKDTRLGCHSLLQRNLPDPGIKPGSPTLQADSLPSEPPGKPKHRWCWVVSLPHASLVSGPLNLALALLGCASSDLQEAVTGISSSAAAPPYLGLWGPLGRGRQQNRDPEPLTF